jgi:hypothetical protein
MKQMTANDIANMVEKEPYHTNLNRITIANFIRQQQAEIESLKTTLSDLIRPKGKVWTDMDAFINMTEQYKKMVRK